MTDDPPKASTDPLDSYLSPEFADDPIAGYDRIRARGRLTWQQAGNAWLLTNYDDAVKALRNPAYVESDLTNMWRVVGRKLKRDYSPILELFAIVPFQHDGARHAELRRILARAVAPFAAREDLFTRRIEMLLAKPLGMGGGDLAEDFARDVLFEIFCDLMEVPESDRSEIREVSRISYILEAYLPVRLRDAAALTVKRSVEYFRAHAQKQIELKRPSFISAIYNELPADEPDRFGVAAKMACIMLIMGNDALSTCITRGVQQLLGERGYQQTPIAQARWGAVSDDVVRQTAPVDLMARTLPSDDVVAGCPLKGGTQLIISTLAGNHDPKHFGEKAHEISDAPTGDVGLAFGAGAHLCVGNRISRNIAKAAMAALARAPAIRITGPAKRVEANVVRVVSSLPVTFG